jgi:hypothetical protein
MDGNGRVMVQPKDQSAFDDSVPPGTYSSITFSGVIMACFEQHAGSNQLIVFGTWDRPTHTWLTPANAPKAA